MARRGRKPGCAKTPGRGRKRGTRNKASVAREAEIKASGLDPLAYMLEVMRDQAETPERRLDAAKAAAPYVHPRLASSSVDMTVNEFDGVTDEQLQQRLALAIAQAKELGIIDEHGNPMKQNGPSSGGNVH